MLKVLRCIMTTKSSSVRVKRRNQLLDAHRARGHAVGNLWYVYSVKTDRDWIIRSDRNLVHWIYFLEINPEVRTFSLTPPPVAISRNGKASEFEFDAEVQTRRDTVERHIVRAVNSESELSDRVQQVITACPPNPSFKVFTDEQLKPHIRIALRWLKAVAYAAVLRNKEHNSYRSAIIAYTKIHGSGTIGAMASDLLDFEYQILLGTLSRLAIEGVVKLDLRAYSFGSRTLWSRES
jgi:hypothetical protein